MALLVLFLRVRRRRRLLTGSPAQSNGALLCRLPAKPFSCSHVTRRIDDEAGGAAISSSQRLGGLSAEKPALFISDSDPPANASPGERTHHRAGAGFAAIPSLSSIYTSGGRLYHDPWTRDAHQRRHGPAGAESHGQARGGDSESDALSMSHVAATVGGAATVDAWDERPPASPLTGHWQRPGGQAEEKAALAGASQTESTAATASDASNAADCSADPAAALDAGTVAQRRARRALARELVARYETDAGIRLAGGPVGGVGWNESGGGDGGEDWDVEGMVDILPPPYVSIARYGS